MHRLRHKVTGRIGETRYKAKKYAVAAMKAYAAIHGDVLEIVSEQRDHRYGIKDTPSQRGWDLINGVSRSYS